MEGFPIDRCNGGPVGMYVRTSCSPQQYSDNNQEELFRRRLRRLLLRRLRPVLTWNVSVFICLCSNLVSAWLPYQY